jgi:hypothetical protein
MSGISPGTGSLDHQWWASDGPTGGYLLRLAIEAARPLTNDGHQVRTATLRVRRQARPAAFTSLASTAPGTAGLGRITVSFDQDGAFADADLTTGPSHESTAEAGALPPPARPAACYMPALMHPGPPPPSTAQFRYRPAVGPDGTGLRPGWEAVWVSPSRRNQIRGTPLITSLVDCWYPASLLRTARRVLSGTRSAAGGPVSEPPPLVLADAHLSFAHSISTAPGDVSSAKPPWFLLAIQLSPLVDGYHLERHEIRSARGRLLATGDILRRARPTALTPYGG